MNCEEFQQVIGSDPYLEDRALNTHARQCTSCAREWEKYLELERQLKTTMQVSAPAVLEKRIYHARKTGRRIMPGVDGAQGLIIGLGLLILLSAVVWTGLNFRGETVYANSLSQTVLYHIQNESGSIPDQPNITPEAVVALFSRHGAVVTGQIGRVLVAHACWIKSRMGLHLVLDGKTGPVTVLFLPGVQSGEAEPVRSARYAGSIIPRSYGSMAVVGTPIEPLGAVIDRLNRWVLWGD